MGAALQSFKDELQADNDVYRTLRTAYKDSDKTVTLLTYRKDQRIANAVMIESKRLKKTVVPSQLYGLPTSHLELLTIVPE